MLMLDTARERHLDGFTIDARQASLFQGDAFDTLHRLVTGGAAIAARWHGQVIGFGGLAQYWQGRAAAWCFLRSDIPRKAWVPLTRAVRESLAASGIVRIEADIRHGIEPAHRWARLLGFEHEGKMPHFWSDGATYHRYARLKPWVPLEAAA
ncbi:hypothetical protein GXW78_26815 [Roseomonas terrae]|uniref:N-acetyltransferase domain-containing protein n=1 Tax=Neoroseomonas terrae TaxID=424799 RepID=A0ABS5EQK0_9PROT|nr:hypothetical protein [Neoroseomonas terrae]MBR0653294.1 hypothetical protein [Neoroseomonas terrae]